VRENSEREKSDEREKLRTEHRARQNDRVQAEGRALENSHEVGCRSGPGEPGAENKTAAQKKVFRTLKSEEQKAPSEGRWKLLPRVRLNGLSRQNRNHLLQRRSHEVSSCPFNQASSNQLAATSTVAEIQPTLAI
jgi:hypothetical protein